MQIYLNLFNQQQVTNNYSHQVKFRMNKQIQPLQYEAVELSSQIKRNSGVRYKIKNFFNKLFPNKYLSELLFHHRNDENFIQSVQEALNFGANPLKKDKDGYNACDMVFSSNLVGAIYQEAAKLGKKAEIHSLIQKHGFDLCDKTLDPSFDLLRMFIEAQKAKGNGNIDFDTKLKIHKQSQKQLDQFTGDYSVYPTELLKRELDRYYGNDGLAGDEKYKLERRDKLSDIAKVLARCVDNPEIIESVIDKKRKYYISGSGEDIWLSQLLHYAKWYHNDATKNKLLELGADYAPYQQILDYEAYCQQSKAKNAETFAKLRAFIHTC